MYKEIYRDLISPLYNYHKETVLRKKDYQFFDYRDFYAVTHKEDIKNKYILQKIVDEGVGLKDYDLVIHIPYTKDMFTSNTRLRFILNNEPLNVMDYYTITINEYLYIFLKKNILSVDNLTIFKFTSSVELNHDISSYASNSDYGISPKFIEEYNHKKYLISYKDTKYLRLTKDKPSIKDILSSNVSYWNYYKNTKIKDIKIYNKTTSEFVQNENKILITYPGMIKLNINAPRSDEYEIYIFIEGNLPNEFTDTPYNETDEENFLLDRIMHLNEKYDNIIEKEHLYEYFDKMIDSTHIAEPENDLQLLRHIMNFNYDLFILLYRRLHRVNIGISCNIFTYVRQTDVNKVKSYINIKDDELDRNMNSFIKFTFVNFKRLPFEIFHNYRKYTDSIFIEHKAYITTVYIPARSFVRYYGYTTTNDLHNKFINIVLRPAESKEIFMNNINTIYNGVMIPSRRFLYDNYSRELYDSGYLIDENDIEYNTIRPLNILAAFPQKKVYPHEINCLIYPSYFKKTVTKYKVKYKNLTQQDKLDFKTTNGKFIVNNHLYLDYIDFTYIIKIGHYILTENIDYIILSPNCIKFINIPVTYDSDYLKLTIELQGDPYLDLIKLSNKSLAKRFVSSDSYKNLLTGDNENISLVYYPGNYDVKVNRWHQMITKYLSTELVIDFRDISIYGNKWLNGISNEFPDFLEEKGGHTILNLSPDFNITKREDFPRIVALPETNNLNTLLTRHLLGISYLNDNGFTNGHTSYIDILNLRKNKKYLSNFKNIDIYMAYGNFEYNCNIPLDVVVQEQDDI